MKAMILAAGLGTRLKPFTDSKPKALFPVGDYTLLQLTILYLKRHGITGFIVNVHHFADQVIEYLEQNKGFGLKYEISDEREELLDTGGAIVKARKYLEGDESFILIGVDVLTGLDLSAMIAYHKQYSPLVTLAVKDRTTSRSLIFDKNYRLGGWRDNSSGETKGITDSDETYALGFSVVHIVNPKIFNYITETGVFSIMESYLRLMSHHQIMGFRHDETSWIEFGRLERMNDIFESREFHQLISQF